MLRQEIYSIYHPVNNIIADYTVNTEKNKGMVIFCHGFKGFKDWGAWSLVARFFATNGYSFLKFNFSHNGIGQKNLNKFTRLDLFKKNNYLKEVKDLKKVIKHILKNFSNQEIHLIGHSRGGGIAAQYAANYNNVKSISLWASIASFNRFGNKETIKEWKKTGYKNVYNSRTKQNMEIGYQFYTKYIKNKDKLNIEKSVKNLNIPMFIAHGKKDEAVGLSNAKKLYKWNPKAELFILDDTDHVFGTQHPYVSKELPESLEKLCKKNIFFIKNLKQFENNFLSN